jgi:hypothetical protein
MKLLAGQLEDLSKGTGASQEERAMISCSLTRLTAAWLGW